MVKIVRTPGEKAAAVRDWTEGSIIQNILLLSWPILVLGLLYTGNLILEMIWVGKLGSASIAGVGVAGFIVLLVVAVKSGFSLGERAMVARFIGAGDVEAANHVAGQAFIISVAYAVLVAVIGILFTGPIFDLFSLEEAAKAEGVSYLRIVLTGWVTESIWITSFSVMQSSGDTITPMKVAVIIRIVNAVICPFMVLGWWIFPRLGVGGAAVTYVCVTGLGAVLCLRILFSGRTRLRLTVKDFRPDPDTIRRILKIGLPGSLTGLGKAFGDLVMTWFMMPFGTVALASHNVISRLEAFINNPGMSLGAGAGVLVGQNLGAGRPGQAARSGWTAVGLAAGFIVICSLVLLLLPEKIIGLFNNDPEMIRVGSVFLRIAIAGYLGMSIVFLMQNCVSGSGDTVPPMLITMVVLWVIQLPLAYLLSRYIGLEVYGVRWAIVVGYIAGAIAYITYFWKGRWKRKRV